MNLSSVKRALPLAIVVSLLGANLAFAEDGEGLSSNELAYAIDNIVLFISAVLVLFMQAGFAMVEAGFNSGKNTVNILFKNLMDMGLGVLLYFLIGYGLMYGDDISGGSGFLAWGGVGISGTSADPVGGSLNPQVDWLFQVAFAATAATIVSGAVAGRMQFRAYMIYSALLTGLIYPISGYWKWGGGWLDAMGFYDFAGSLVVHAVGGFGALAGAIVLGPRIGRFNKDGSANPMPGHNITLATLGVFILLIGWFGFNPGSQLAFAGASNTDAVMLIASNTLLAACAGALFAMITSLFTTGKPDLSISLNGLLAGLVGITANCDSVSNISAIIIGAVAGVLVVGGMILLEKIQIDDPVGAWPVHGLCGIWGGIATALFGSAAGHTLMPQIVGSIAIPIWAFVTMFGVFYAMKVVGILRVTPEEEIEGLDITEHGAINYPEFGATIVGSRAGKRSMMPDVVATPASR